MRWGAAEWAGVADGFKVRSQPLVLRRPGGELRLEGEMESGEKGGRDALDVRVRFTRWPAADFVKALEWDVKVAGLLTRDPRKKESKKYGLVKARKAKQFTKR